MAYIGKTPVLGNFVKLDAISVVNGQAAYTMQNGGVNFTSYDNVNQFLVSLNGILQSPTDSFTVSGSTLTFASNLSTGDVIDFVMVLGNTLDVGTPSDNTVSLAKLTATGTKDATTFLRGDNTFAEVVSGLTMADQWRLTTDFSGDADITSNLERNDSTGFSQLGTGMSESSGIFTFPSTGIYLIKFIAQFSNDTTSSRASRNRIKVTTDNSSYSTVTTGSSSINAFSSYAVFTQTISEYILDVTDTSNIKVKFNVDQAANDTVTLGSTTENNTYMTFIKLGDT
jgi:hypothetical protein